MDDTRTRDTLDALADLFLSDPPSTRTPPDAAAPRSDPLGGPAPIRLSPKLSASPAKRVVVPRSADDSRDQPSDLSPADAPPLRLTTHRPASAPPKPKDSTPDRSALTGNLPPRPVHAEAVLLGNLPGFAAPWLAQYASHLAQHHGPVALIHLDADRAELELVGAQPQPDNLERQDHLTPDQPADAGHPRTPEQPGPSIARLLDRLADGPASIGRVLIHLPTPLSAVDLRRAHQVRRWTLLTGSDDAAIVGAHRMIRQLLEADAHGDVHIAGKSDPSIRLMFMGCDAHQADAALAKLNATARSFLRRGIQSLGHRRRMEPVNLQFLGGFQPPTDQPSDTDAVWRSLADWLARRAHQPPPAPQTAAPTTPTPTSPAGPPSPGSHLPHQSGGFSPGSHTPSSPTHRPSSNPDLSRRVTPEEWDDLRELEAELLAAARSLGVDGPPPHPSHAHTASPPEPPPTPPDSRPEADTLDQPDLAALLTCVPGAVRLDARCPHETGTQLLLDQQGRLHLLRRHPSDRDPAALRAAVVDLLATRRWVREHLPLLRLTQRQCLFRDDAEPALHLFTPDAKSAVGLAQRLGNELQLHLLQQVRLGNQSTWLCNDLT